MSNLTAKQMEQARRKIRKHYRLNRRVTDEEVLGEVQNLLRRQRGLILDDFDLALAASLETGPHPVDFDSM